MKRKEAKRRKLVITTCLRQRRFLLLLQLHTSTWAIYKKKKREKKNSKWRKAHFRVLHEEVQCTFSYIRNHRFTCTHASHFEEIICMQRARSLTHSINIASSRRTNCLFNILLYSYDVECNQQIKFICKKCAL